MKEEYMKKEISKQSALEDNNIQPEYNFTKIAGGIKGKYYQAYRAGHTVKIHREDGTTLVQHFKLEDGAVMLEPDIRKYFPDSKTVNKALRCLIPLLPKKRGSATRNRV
ncbi:MAG: hypothetical protein Q8S01_09280 [Ignavibacteria bacterium]|nr:hypothetical protein [Ignavibacteria bacterium]